MSPLVAAIIVFLALWFIQSTLKRLFDITMKPLAFGLLAGAVSFIVYSFV